MAKKHLKVITGKLLLSMMMLFGLVLTASAQDVQPKQIHFGYFSYSKVLKSMDGYIIARHGIDELRRQYDAEAKRSEDDFNTKYEAFLEEQEGLASNIRKKRQAELMELMEKNQSFKKEAERLIREAEKSSNDSLCRLIDSSVHAIGVERGYAFIINTDNHSLPFVNNAVGEDISAMLEQRLSKK